MTVSDVEDEIKALLEVSITSDRRDAAFQSVVAGFRRTKHPLTTMHVLEVLGPALCDTSPIPRKRAVGLLAQIFEHVPELPLTRTDLSSILKFMVQKLEDWHCIDGAVKALLFLLRHHKSIATGLVSVDHNNQSFVCVVFTKVIKHVHAPSYAQSLRHSVLELLAVLLQDFDDEIITLGADVVDGVVHECDDERDPRNLKVMFPLIGALVRKYSSFISDRKVKEIGDMLFAYWPCAFEESPTHPVSSIELNESLVSVLSADILVRHIMELLVHNAEDASETDASRRDAVLLLKTFFGGFDTSFARGCIAESFIQSFMQKCWTLDSQDPKRFRGPEQRNEFLDAVAQFFGTALKSCFSRDELISTSCDPPSWYNESCKSLVDRLLDEGMKPHENKAVAACMQIGSRAHISILLIIWRSSVWSVIKSACGSSDSSYDIYLDKLKTNHLMLSHRGVLHDLSWPSQFKNPAGDLQTVLLQRITSTQNADEQSCLFSLIRCCVEIDSDLGPPACAVVMKQYQNCISPLATVTHHVPFIIDNAYPGQSEKKTQSFDTIMKMMDRRNSDGDMFCAIRVAIISLEAQYISRVMDVMWKSTELCKRAVKILTQQIVSSDFSDKKLQAFAEVLADAMSSRFSERAPLFAIGADDCSTFLCQLACHLDKDRLASVFNFVAQADVTYCLIPKILPVFHSRGMAVCTDSMADLFDKCVQFGIAQRKSQPGFCTSISDSGGMPVDVFEVLGQLGVVDKHDLLPGGRLHQYTTESSEAGPIVLTAFLKGSCFCGTSGILLGSDAFASLVRTWVDQMAMCLDKDAKSYHHRIVDVWHCILLLLAPADRAGEGLFVAPAVVPASGEVEVAIGHAGRRLPADLHEYIASKLIPRLSGAMLVVALDSMPTDRLVQTYQKQVTSSLSCFMEGYQMHDVSKKSKMVEPMVYHAARLSVCLAQKLDYFSNEFIMRTVQFWCDVLGNDLDPFCRVCAALVLNGFQEPSSSTNGEDYSPLVVRALSQSMSDPAKQVRRVARVGLNNHLW